MRIPAPLLLALAALAAPAYAQTVTLDVSPDKCLVSCAPIATWSTTPAAASCTASNGWSGPKLASGVETLPATSTAKTYKLDCTWPGGSTATITWVPPTQRTDNTPITSIDHFRINYGLGTSFAQNVEVPGNLTSYVISSGLTPGAWSFRMTATETAGAESDVANVATKTVAAGVTGTASDSVTVQAAPKPPTMTVTIAQAFEVVPDLLNFAFNAGKQVGTARVGAACDKARGVGDGLYALVSMRDFTPFKGVARPAAVLASCS